MRQKTTQIKEQTLTKNKTATYLLIFFATASIFASLGSLSAFIAVTPNTKKESIASRIIDGNTKARTPQDDTLFTQRDKQYPYVPGEILVKFKTDEHVQNLKDGKIPNSTLQNIVEENNFSFEFQKNNPENNYTKEIGLDRIVKFSSEKIRTADENFFKKTPKEDLERGAKSKEITEMIQALKKIAIIDYAEPNAQFFFDTEPNDTYYPVSEPNADGWPTYLWGLHRIGLETAWDKQKGNKNTIIFVADTGLYVKHPDLMRNVWVNSGEDVGVDGVPDSQEPGYNQNTNPDPNHDNYPSGTEKNGTIEKEENNNKDDDANDWVDDFYGPREDYGGQDNAGHGTHVSGTIAATANNTRGVVGVCWSCRIMITRLGDVFEYLSVAQYAVKHGARIVHLSASTPEYSQTIKDIADYFYKNNMPYIVSAGNTRRFVSTYPQLLNNTIAVASLDPDDYRSYFSSHGPGVEVIAPGSYIISTISPGGSYCKVPLGSDPKAQYCYMSGTSMSAPHVTGLVGLLTSQTPSLKVDEIAQILKSSADDLGKKGWDIEYGYGLINPTKALQITSVLTPHLSYPQTNTFIPDATEIKGSVSGKFFGYAQLEWGAGYEPTQWKPLQVFKDPIPETQTLYSSLKTKDLPGIITVRLRAQQKPAKPAEQTQQYEDRIVIDNGTLGIDAPNDVKRYSYFKGENVEIYGRVGDVYNTQGKKRNSLFKKFEIFYRKAFSHGTWHTVGVKLTNDGQYPIQNGLIELCREL